MTTSGPRPLDADLAGFIESVFPSVWALETLLVMRRDPERVWPGDLLVKELRASGNLISDCLRTLERAGLVAAQDGGHRYQPASAAMAELVDRLAATYAERPFSITNVITARRSNALKGFADSFRLGKWNP